MAPTLFRMPLRDRDALIAAGVAVLFLHLLIYALLPHDAAPVRSVAMPKPERIQVKLLAPVEEPEANYLRANPEVAPEAPPPETLDYSNRDQVAAQETVTPLSDDNLPAQEGDSPESNRLVQGDPFRTPPTPAQAVNQQPVQQAANAIPQQMPAPREVPRITAPEVMEATPESEDGLLAREEVADNPEVPEELETAEELQPQPETSQLDGTGNAPSFTPPQQANPAPSPQEPRPQPRLARENSFGPLRDSTFGVARQGRISFSTRYTEFGEYWNRVIEVIEKQWNNLVMASFDAVTFDGSRVRLEVLINREGQVVEVQLLESDGSRFEELLARDAIQSRAPFPEWTPNMILTMGEETTLTLGFIY